MKIKDILELTREELAVRRHELKDEIFHLRLQQQGGQLERPSQLRTLRREIARLATVLTQKTKAATTPAK
jgi:large subunit ribosomal protein L29